MNDIKEFYRSYLHATEEIITALKEDDYNKVDELLNLREKLLQELEADGFEKEALSEEIDLNSILALEKNLKNIIKGKETEIEQRLSNLAKSKRATSLYYNADNGSATVFNKTI